MRRRTSMAAPRGDHPASDGRRFVARSLCQRRRTGADCCHGSLPAPPNSTLIDRRLSSSSAFAPRAERRDGGTPVSRANRRQESRSTACAPDAVCTSSLETRRARSSAFASFPSARTRCSASTLQRSALAARDKVPSCHSSRAEPTATIAEKWRRWTNVTFAFTSLKARTSSWPWSAPAARKMSLPFGCPHQEPLTGAPATIVATLGSFASCKRRRPQRSRASRARAMPSFFPA